MVKCTHAPEVGQHHKNPPQQAGFFMPEISLHHNTKQGKIS
jgi:hypothetical protein